MLGAPRVPQIANLETQLVADPSVDDAVGMDYRVLSNAGLARSGESAQIDSPADFGSRCLLVTAPRPATRG